MSPAGWQAVEMPWLGLGGPILVLVRKRHSHLVGAWAQNGCLLAESADYCKFVNEAWLRSRVCVL